MDFQYISISVYIVRSNARIQRGGGGRGSGPLSNTRSNPLKFSEQPSQHSTLGHHRHASETPLKICACGRKYANCRTKADAHDKMDFQYISICVYIVRSNARIQRGQGSGPLSNTRSNPLNFSEQPSQHSTFGHHRHASETPLKAFGLQTDDGPLLVSEFGSRSDPNGIQERMFRQLNIWACDRKHAKHQFCRISDF